MRGLLFGLSGLIALATPAAALELSSADVHDGQPIAVEHNYPRCGGKNLSPALSWSGVPAKAKSLVLTMIDRSVKPNGWSHWVAVDLAPTAGALPQGANALPHGAHGLQSDFGDTVYDGPCPPKGTGTHVYELTIWALPEAKASTTDGSAKIETWLEKHAIAKARISGTVTP
jgi:Raf kinase inhibitor-like YbhB/YbcL family protein